MSKFIYRMQNVLNIKNKLEAQAKQEYSAARAALNEEEDKLERLYKRKADYEEEARTLMSSKLDVHKINENNAAIMTMQNFIALQQDEVRRAELMLERARQKLEEVMKERKAQEILRDNAFEQFLQEEKAQESKEIDELVSYQYGQKIQVND
ncbi:MAG: flagellar export protein FliJ [Lachnospiraceae bacterium]|nr:flagellar export protein FliJ [Lachnospiraceae bacterium]